MYGTLRHQDVPDVPIITLPGWLQSMAWLKTPRLLKPEIKAIANQLGSKETAIAYNLHYELSGLGCITAALPANDLDGYKFCRQLEWDVGFSPAFDFQQIQGVAHLAKVRHTAGFVGALSGHTQQWSIAMNYAPDIDVGVNIHAQPVAWLIRKAIARGKGYAETRDWLLKQRVIRAAYVTIVSHDQAAWLALGVEGGGPLRNFIVEEKKYPDTLMVGNEMAEIYTSPDDWENVCMDAYQAEPHAWILDRYAHEA